MTIDDVHGSLSEAIAGTLPRPGPTDRVIVDSTGTALQDQAIASLMFRHAVESGAGRSVDLV